MYESEIEVNSMLRDMEELLNSVYDLETKDYLREALNCYNSGSYKACVIMSVISGVYDLHKKVKSLASSHRSYRDLDDEVTRKKQELSPYEKYLIEQCSTDEIDMLNSVETKVLQQCLDTRNACAHPSEIICSPEKARDVYSSIIDIICSKPVLYGCNNLTNMIKQLEEDTFFYALNEETVMEVVKENLFKFHNKAKAPLLRNIAQTIIDTENDIQRENALWFLAISEKCIDNFEESYLEKFLNKENEKYLLELLSINTGLLNYFSDSNIKRIMRKFNINLESQKINNLSNWICVLLSERFIRNNYTDEIVCDLFCNSQWRSSNKFDTLKKILENDNCPDELKAQILIKAEENVTDLINDNTITDPIVLELIQILDSNTFYGAWIETIINSLKSTRDFYRMNSIIEVSFRKIPQEKWIQKVSDNQKIEFIKWLVNEANINNPYYSSSARVLLENLSQEYPDLVKVFRENLLQDVASEFNKPWYQDTILAYIMDEESKDQYRANFIGDEE